MIFHENRLLADDSHEISYLIYLENWERNSKFPSAAIVIGALRVNEVTGTKHLPDKLAFSQEIMSSGCRPDHAQTRLLSYRD